MNDSELEPLRCLEVDREYRKVEVPLLSATRHLLQSNGSISGVDISTHLRKRFSTLSSVMPYYDNDYDNNSLEGFYNDEGRDEDEDVASARHHSSSFCGNETSAERVVKRRAVLKRPTLASIDGRLPIDHGRISQFLNEDFPCLLHKSLKHHPSLELFRGTRIALALPNGPELALAILAVVHVAVCVPLNVMGAERELQQDIRSSYCDIVIGPCSSSDGYEQARGVAKSIGIPYIGLIPSHVEAGIFSLSPAVLEAQNVELDKDSSCSRLSTSQSKKPNILPAPNALDDDVLLLFTSGTAGTKKLVPHTLENILVGSACISLSWNLSPEDINCNLMPLFHVGGIVRQVFAPILSGGCVICCPSFDATVFWKLVERKFFTWYYAAPTMHSIILKRGKELNYIPDVKVCTPQIAKHADRYTVSSTSRVRMIANAAGGLLPSLALELRQTFRASVLPSYGMTECMPITSPPANYALERPGTSGVSVGPEVAILNSAGEELPVGEEGNICVRGRPLMKGYDMKDLDNPDEQSCFMNNGWFNTGDLGYQDIDGYLYVTGRSKEVINRAGEIISPFEIEEAVIGHEYIQDVLAFSVRHDVLQEVVGVVVVPVKDKRRIDLPSLHYYLRDKLTPSKWPQCIVFMDHLPRTVTNKVQRVALDKKLQLPLISDSLPSIVRTFEVRQISPLSQSHIDLHCTPVSVRPDVVERILFSKLLNENKAGRVIVKSHPNRPGSLVCYVYGIDRLMILQMAEESLDAYLVPSHFVKLTSLLQDLPAPSATDSAAAVKEGISEGKSADAVVREIQHIFMTALALECIPRSDVSFFDLGGSSLLASQVGCKIRKRFGVRISGVDIFHHPSCRDLSKIIKERCGNSNFSIKHIPVEESYKYEFRKKYGLSSYIVQSLPLLVIDPVYSGLHFVSFIAFVGLFKSLFEEVHFPLISFLSAIVATRCIFAVLSPILFIFIKWTIVGKYRAGYYEFWGNYYLRWWLVDFARTYFEKGVFGTSPRLLNLYYKLLGAKVGRNVLISTNADLAEYDLICIGEGARIDSATLRGFTVDSCRMHLAHVSIGVNSGVGAKSIVIPNTQIPDYEHLGPGATSLDAEAFDETFSKFNRASFPEPNFCFLLLVGYPLLLIVELVKRLPAIYILHYMISKPWYQGQLVRMTIYELILWFSNVQRVPYIIGIRLCKAVVSPLLHMMVTIFIKRLLVGKFAEGPLLMTQWNLCRHWLMYRLCSQRNLEEFSLIIGKNFEGVSWLYRFLGSKIGKRVFWASSNISFSGEFDLLEVGDDCVFGSRTLVVCSANDCLKSVKLSAGSNVSDSCILLPGATLGKNAVLGSSSICPYKFYLPEDSTWFGARGCQPVQLERGTEVSTYNKFIFHGDKTTLKPYGRAVLGNASSYWKWSLPVVVLMSIIISILRVILHTVPILGALQITRHFIYMFNGQGALRLSLTIFIYSYITASILRLTLWFMLDAILAKRVIIGQRQPGVYNWDQSSYPQRWAMYTTVTSAFRKFGSTSILNLIRGSPYMNLFCRANGCRLGNNVCLYPAGNRNQPFMSEPDLVTIKADSVIDDAAVICHLNTRGNFVLKEINIGRSVTLKCMSRVQQGASVGDNVTVLERGLIMTGEIADRGTVWKGAPAIPVSDRSRFSLAAI